MNTLFSQNRRKYTKSDENFRTDRKFQKTFVSFSNNFNSSKLIEIRRKKMRFSQ